MKSHNVEIRTFAELSASELYEILKARFRVFVVEQQCFYLDMDDIDYRSLHLFLREGAQVVAYARLFADDGDAWRIGRVLSVRRGEGLGRTVMEAAIGEARQRSAESIVIDAQTHATGFYERLGFRVCSEEFEEAGIPHVKMVLQNAHK